MVSHVDHCADGELIIAYPSVAICFCTIIRLVNMFAARDYTAGGESDPYDGSRVGRIISPEAVSFSYPIVEQLKQCFLG